MFQGLDQSHVVIGLLCFVIGLAIGMMRKDTSHFE